MSCDALGSTAGAASDGSSDKCRRRLTTTDNPGNQSSAFEGEMDRGGGDLTTPPPKVMVSTRTVVTSLKEFEGVAMVLDLVVATFVRLKIAIGIIDVFMGDASGCLDGFDGWTDAKAGSSERDDVRIAGTVGVQVDEDRRGGHLPCRLGRQCRGRRFRHGGLSWWRKWLSQRWRQ